MFFQKFQDHDGNFKQWLCEDVKGLLSLYEASHLAFDGENILDEAKVFTTKHPKGIKGNIDKTLTQQIKHALELPFHHRMLRLEARWYIQAYSERRDANHLLLELAKLDFNMVQSKLQRELQQMSRWWEDIGLENKLSFARDRLMECFFWTVGMVFEPQFSSCRKGLMKVTTLITTIDDVYDVYGSLDELELFTAAVERWNTNVMETLPDYMKLCFLTLYNTVNEMTYDTLKQHGVNIIPYLTRAVSSDQQNRNPERQANARLEHKDHNSHGLCYHRSAADLRAARRCHTDTIPLLQNTVAIHHSPVSDQAVPSSHPDPYILNSLRLLATCFTD
ncbi:hypothetical protein LOK49_LG06G01513 [Camellia lanceoleosa]|uniref:Uncharacterized protein n=1 Tax=Camellia lanceoleosa TaxID=1840588 RepID=A0ACC0HHM4_9ERIC|nr:hypothetical protein LOK49_LG06G01513 [Camellia lanceoleosa]